jgi:glycosyltransferase involved in cell wall biosynthesis
MTIYNPGEHLRPALNSLFDQSMQDFELVVVENGSRDGAKSIIREYAHDPRVRLIDLPQNIGRVPALNQALEHARAPYVAILDADDIAYPARLATQVELLDRHPDVVLVASHVDYIDETGKVIGKFTAPNDPRLLHERLSYANPFNHSACTFRRDAALALGGYNSRYPIGNDFDLWLRLAEKGSLAIVEAPLAAIRYHSAQTTFASASGFARSQDSIDIYRRALSRPGLSREARRLGRANLATHHFVFGRELWQAGRPGAAVQQLISALVIAPVFVMRRLLVRLRRVTGRQAS